MQGQTIEQKAEIKAVKELTKEITVSKKKAEKYLRESGILAFVEEANKATHNGKHSGRTR